MMAKVVRSSAVAIACCFQAVALGAPPDVPPAGAPGLGAPSGGGMVVDASGRVSGRARHGLLVRQAFGYPSIPLPALPREADWLRAAELAGLDTECDEVRTSLAAARKAFVDREAAQRQQKFQAQLAKLEAAADAAHRSMVSSFEPETTEFISAVFGDTARLLRVEADALRTALVAANEGASKPRTLDPIRVERVIAFLSRRSLRMLLWESAPLKQTTAMREDLEGQPAFARPEAWAVAEVPTSLVEYEREAQSRLLDVLAACKAVPRAGGGGDAQEAEAARRRLSAVAQRLFDFEVRAADALVLPDRVAAATLRLSMRAGLSPPMAAFLGARAQLELVDAPAGPCAERLTAAREILARAIAAMDAATRERNLDLMQGALAPSAQTEANQAFDSRMRAAREACGRELCALLMTPVARLAEGDPASATLDANLATALRSVVVRSADGAWKLEVVADGWPGQWGGIAR